MEVATCSLLAATPEVLTREHRAMKYMIEKMNGGPAP